jgi:hypothetical protein
MVDPPVPKCPYHISSPLPLILDNPFHGLHKKKIYTKAQPLPYPDQLHKTTKKNFASPSKTKKHSKQKKSTPSNAPFDTHYKRNKKIRQGKKIKNKEKKPSLYTK